MFAATAVWQNTHFASLTTACAPPLLLTKPHPLSLIIHASANTLQNDGSKMVQDAPSFPSLFPLLCHFECLISSSTPRFPPLHCGRFCCESLPYCRFCPKMSWGREIQVLPSPALPGSSNPRSWVPVNQGGLHLSWALSVGGFLASSAAW